MNKNSHFEDDYNDIRHDDGNEKFSYFKLGQIRLKNYHNEIDHHNEFIVKYSNKNKKSLYRFSL